MRSTKTPSDLLFYIFEFLTMKEMYVNSQVLSKESKKKFENRKIEKERLEELKNKGFWYEDNTKINYLQTIGIICRLDMALSRKDKLFVFNDNRFLYFKDLLGKNTTPQGKLLLAEIKEKSLGFLASKNDEVDYVDRLIEIAQSEDESSAKLAAAKLEKLWFSSQDLNEIKVKVGTFFLGYKQTTSALIRKIIIYTEVRGIGWLSCKDKILFNNLVSSVIQYLQRNSQPLSLNMATIFKNCFNNEEYSRLAIINQQPDTFFYVLFKANNSVHSQLSRPFRKYILEQVIHSGLQDEQLATDANKLLEQLSPRAGLELRSFT